MEIVYIDTLSNQEVQKAYDLGLNLFEGIEIVDTNELEYDELYKTYYEFYIEGVDDLLVDLEKETKEVDR